MSGADPVEIRRAEPRHYERIGQLTEAAYLALWPDGLGGYDVVIHAVADRARHDEVWVALIDDRVVGSLTYVADSRSPSAQWDDREAVGFRMLAVDVAHWGSGVGRALVDAVLDRARADGHPRVRIHSHELMATARGMYERIGFVRDPAMDFTDDDEESVIGFVLHLDEAVGS